jgi:hypothetical protein
MASAAVVCSIRETSSLSEAWRSPLGVGSLWLSGTEVPGEWMVHVNGNVSRVGCPHASCKIAVIGQSGTWLHSQLLETDAKALIEVIRAVPKGRQLCLE